MDLENLKNVWSEEKISETPEISLEKQKEIRMPLEKIRENLKSLILKTGIAFIFLIVALYYLDMFSTSQKILNWGMFIFVYVIILIYYFTKFFGLYKKLNQKYQLTFDYLGELRTDLRIQGENLKSYYVATIPLFLAELFLIVPSVKVDVIKTIYFISIALFIIVVIYFRMKYYLRNNFLKHIERIDSLHFSLK